MRQFFEFMNVDVSLYLITNLSWKCIFNIKDGKLPSPISRRPEPKPKMKEDRQCSGFRFGWRWGYLNPIAASWKNLSHLLFLFFPTILPSIPSTQLKQTIRPILNSFRNIKKPKVPMVEAEEGRRARSRQPNEKATTRTPTYKGTVEKTVQAPKVFLLPPPHPKLEMIIEKNIRLATLQKV